MGDYTSDRETALELLEDAGGPVTLIRTVDGPYDPEEGGSTTSTSEIKGVGVVIPIKAGRANGTSVQVGDQRLLYQGDEVEMGDTLGGYQIVSVENLDPDSSGLILQTAIMRR